MAKKITEDGEIIDELCEDCGPIFWKTPWNHDTKAESDRVGLTCKDPSMAQQQFQDEVNLTNIVNKFLQTGTPFPEAQAAMFRDMEEFVDLQDSMVTQYDVQKAWNELPSAARNILRDPKTFADYVDHCVSTGDIEPLRELGLAPARPPEPAITPGGGSPAPQPPAGASNAPTNGPSGT